MSGKKKLLPPQAGTQTMLSKYFIKPAGTPTSSPAAAPASDVSALAACASIPGTPVTPAKRQRSPSGPASASRVAGTPSVPPTIDLVDSDRDTGSPRVSEPRSGRSDASAVSVSNARTATVNGGTLGSDDAAAAAVAAAAAAHSPSPRPVRRARKRLHRISDSTDDDDSDHGHGRVKASSDSEYDAQRHGAASGSSDSGAGSDDDAAVLDDKMDVEHTAPAAAGQARAAPLPSVRRAAAVAAPRAAVPRLRSPAAGGGSGLAKLAAGRFDSDPETHARWAARLLPDQHEVDAAARGAPGGHPAYTPFEKQYLQLRAQYPDVLLLIECGYKFRFLGEDAEVAAKELGLYCYRDHNFMTASVPVPRLPIHVKRLVEAGHKVGVVRQTETAALKAVSSNKSAPFTRKLSALYTKGTFVMEAFDMSGAGEDAAGGATAAAGPQGAAPGTSFLLCLAEDSVTERGARVSMVACDTASGQTVWDSFEDNAIRSALETRLAHLQAAELLVPQRLSAPAERLLHEFGNTADAPRIERRPVAVFTADKSLDTLRQYYLRSRDPTAAGAGAAPQPAGEAAAAAASVTPGSESTASGWSSVESLPLGVRRVLAVLLAYLQEFGLDRVLRLTGNFVHFSSHAHMVLSGNTLHNLEILRDQSLGSERGSLYWLLNHARTPMGARLVRLWVSRPLLDRAAIESRLAAVEELALHPPAAADPLLHTLVGTPDLERALCRVLHRKASPLELIGLLKMFQKLCRVLPPPSAFRSSLLQQILRDMPDVSDECARGLAQLNEQAAVDGDLTALFVDDTPFPEVARQRKAVAGVLAELQAHLLDVRRLLARPTLEYKTVMGVEFLIEVTQARAKDVPKNWVRNSSTKEYVRFVTPFVAERSQALQRHRDLLAAACSQAWQQFLEDFCQHYHRFHALVRGLATVDALVSLAAVARLPGYCKPQVVDEPVVRHDARAALLVAVVPLLSLFVLDIRAGRHPVAETVLTTPYVPNDTHMAADGLRCMIITGPNMGGKSCYIRQAVLIAVMAQIGSFVPAESARVGVFDAVFTRMGAADDLARGRSTFFIELQETSEILSRATSRSLIVLDELGRGTATHDGTAIAWAVLRHIVLRLRCLTLFVTHYPLLGELAREMPDAVGNFHMSYVEGGADEAGRPAITFLYKVARGLAQSSFGMNVARLAQIPESIVSAAAAAAAQLESEMQAQRRQRVAQAALQRLAATVLAADSAGAVAALQDMHRLHRESEQAATADTGAGGV